jgi:hypothetical protein
MTREWEMMCKGWVVAYIMIIRFKYAYCLRHQGDEPHFPVGLLHPRFAGSKSAEDD